MKLLVISVLAFSVLIISCKEKPTKMTNDNSVENIFPKGEPGPPEHFTGKAWNFGLVSNDSINNTLVGNVYFEPGARSNWHSHPSGQILIITGVLVFTRYKGNHAKRSKREM